MFCCCSFQGPEEKWTKSYSELPSNECLLANCILATAFIVYCGPLSPRARYVCVCHCVIGRWIVRERISERPFGES